MRTSAPSGQTNRTTSAPLVFGMGSAGKFHVLQSWGPYISTARSRSRPMASSGVTPSWTVLAWFMPESPPQQSQPSTPVLMGIP